jgi:hypothetical protein
MMSVEKIIARVKLLRRLYIFVIVLVSLALLSALFLYSADNMLVFVLETAFMIYIFMIIYFGLRRVRHWVTSLIQITSAFNLLILIAGLATPYEDTLDFAIGRPLEIFLIAFFVYQMIFFSKKEVKVFFKSTSKTFFSI